MYTLFYVIMVLNLSILFYVYILISSIITGAYMYVGIVLARFAPPRLVLIYIYTCTSHIISYIHNIILVSYIYILSYCHTYDRYLEQASMDSVWAVIEW